MVLIIDDHEDTCRVLQRLLRLDGVPAECVHDGRQALELAEALRPTVIVLDQMMPGLKGTEVLRSLKRKPHLAAIPAIFYSAAEEGNEEARRLGAMCWLRKSTTWEELRRCIIDAYRGGDTPS